MGGLRLVDMQVELVHQVTAECEEVSREMMFSLHILNIINHYNSLFSPLSMNFVLTDLEDPCCGSDCTYAS